MFPEIKSLNITDSVDNKSKIDFVFENGQHILKDNGILKECSIRERLQNWIEKVVRTQAGAYEVYTKDEVRKFGVNIYEVLGTKNKGYWLSELKREITEQLIDNSEIERVEDYKAEIDKRSVKISFRVVTVDGIKNEIEVIV